jgi:hypothetical protein
MTILSLKSRASYQYPRAWQWHGRSRAMKILMQVFGVCALLAGLLFIGQGTGYVRWPETSTMIGVSDWILRGAILALGGALMLLYGSRR